MSEYHEDVLFTHAGYRGQFAMVRVRNDIEIQKCINRWSGVTQGEFHCNYEPISITYAETVAGFWYILFKLIHMEKNKE